MPIRVILIAALIFTILQHFISPAHAGAPDYTPPPKPRVVNQLCENYKNVWPVSEELLAFRKACGFVTIPQWGHLSENEDD